MPKFNAQIFAEGVGLGGGMSSEAPHIEVIEEVKYIDTKVGYINENVNASIQIPIPRNLSQKVDINDKSIDNKISEKIVITLE